LEADGVDVHGDHENPALVAALEALQRERARHEAIAELGLVSLRGSTERAELVEQALDALRRLLPCDHAGLLEVGSDELTILHSDEPRAVGAQLARTGSLVDLAIRSGVPTRVNDLAGDPRLGIDDRFLVEGLHAGWAVPLDVAGSLQALSCVAREPWTDHAEGEAFLQAVANVLVADAAKRAAEEAARSGEERFRRLAENVPDAVFHLLLRPERRLDYISPRYADLSGLPLEVLEQDPTAWRQVVPTADLDAVEDLLVREGDEVIASAPYRIVRPDGTVRWVETRAAPLRNADGELAALFGATRDITVLQETEEALRRALEHEQRATEELRQVGEIKNALLAAVSHELRTPLTSVVGFAELLRQHDAELSGERRQHLLSSLCRNAIRLERLLGDLLDLDRLDRSVVEPVRRPTPVSELVARVISRLDARDRTIHVELEPVVASIDGPKVERIVENLLVNALKHTHAGSSIWVRIEAARCGVLLTIEDDGPGVSDELKPLIFDAFVQGEGPHLTHSPGTGIGLSLVARFAELHGGSASVADRAGGGARFQVYLPDGPPEVGEGDLAHRAVTPP
jgi:PAS domain S-box-containing protein